ncbi:MAG: discoidin domain-containing protein [Prevotellaceae bacterium]|nr:discoidin domain-containing protein [Prevotellaceae bacterium]MDY3365453.1 discoidin domain-containing protein [Prevotella sp.]
MKANKNQHYEGQITNATILYPSASSSPSQGANNFVGYQPTYWQYMDKVVYWAGSSSEGVICPPAADATDAAHLSGVKMLGILNFQPEYYGGNPDWFNELFKSDGGTYPYAVKLYEMAKYMGFDGWFINYEVNSYAETNVPEFIKKFQSLAANDGNHHMEIMWYKGHKSDTDISILKSHKNTSQFIDYGGLRSYLDEAGAMGVERKDVFSKVYAGIECVQSGHLGYGHKLRQVLGKTEHIGSVALFCPEENVWKEEVKNLLNTPNAQGDAAYRAMKRVFEKENQTWINRDGDPSFTSELWGWPGLSGCILERSAITSMPFVSDMCVGIGKHRFIKGEQVATQDWWHRGVQSVMPTWRYWIENRGDQFNVEVDWEDAYNFGNCIKFSGQLAAGSHLTRLYKTKIEVNNGGIFRVVYKKDGNFDVIPKLSTDGTINPNVTLTAVTSRTENEWTIDEYALTSLNGNTINMIALDLKVNVPEGSDELCDFYLGQIAVLPANYAPTAATISNFKAEGQMGEEKGDARLSWDYNYTADFDRFDIYTENLSGAKVLRGQTRGEGFYIPAFNRNELDETVKVEVVPVMKDGREGSRMSANLRYPAMSKPVVTIVPKKSYLSINETTELTMRATGRPTDYTWHLPESLELMEGNVNSTDIKVRAKGAGKQNIRVEVTNSAGTTDTTIVALDVISSNEAAKVQNVIRNKRVTGYSSSANPRENPNKIVDGKTGTRLDVSDKWCVTKPEAWAEFDLGGNYRIYGFKIHDCKSGPENNENFDEYKIYLSDDGRTWNLAVDEKGRMSDDVKEDYIIPTKARYVKLVPTVNNVLRIWEFEVFGQEDSNLSITTQPQVTVNVKDNYILKVNYDLNGDARQSQFTCTATSNSQRMLTIGSIEENAAEKCFNVTLKSLDEVGPVDVVVRVTNGNSYKETTVKVVIDNPNAVNVLTGLDAEVRKYDADYSSNASYESETENALTDGDKKSGGIPEWFAASVYRQDVMAIFTAPDGRQWNLSKVKVYFKNNNVDLSDDGEEGPAVEKIEAWTSDDMQNWKKATISDNLGSVNSVEHLFAEPVKAKYLAIVSTQKALFYSTISEVEAYEAVSNTGNTEDPATPAETKVMPLSLTGWTHDGIAEATPAADRSGSITSSGWAFYSSGVQDAGAIADDSRKVTSASGVEYILAPYDQKNMAKVSSYEGPVTLTLANPVSADELYVLGAGADGRGAIKIEAVYTDGTKSEPVTMQLQDWTAATAADKAVSGLGRIKRNSNYTYNADTVEENVYSLAEGKVAVDKTKQIARIVFTDADSFGYPLVMAVTAKVNGVSTGVTLNTTSADAQLIGIYNLNGMKLEAPIRGVNVFRYSDGTTRKVFVK